MVIKLEEGQKVPADCILMNSDNGSDKIKVREISNTGEPDIFEKVPIDSCITNY
jgi:magnesium-transporting ATPase (P-type)